MNKESKQIKKIIEKAKKDKRVIAVALFGSSVKKKGRDIDICIFLDKKYLNIEMSKKQIEFFGISPENVDIEIFQQLPIYIRIRIIKEGKILLSKNMDLIYDIAFDTIKEFEFFKKTYELYLEGVKNG